MKVKRSYILAGGAALGAALLLTLPGAAQNAAQAGPSQGRQAAETRKAVFHLIGANFRPLGAVLKGEKPYEAAEAEKRINRIAFLSELLDETFPDYSNLGLPDTKTRAEAWTNKDDFAKKLKEFKENVANLQTVNAKDKAQSDAFKTALSAVGQNCKGCHDTYKEK